LDITSEVTGGVSVYRIAGRIDASTSGSLESAVRPATGGSNPRVIFDMRDVAYISSAGLRVVLQTAKHVMAAKGAFAVFGLQPAVLEVFKISGFENIIPIAADVAEARAKVGA
jgi:anti-anti-sigma factor